MIIYLTYFRPMKSNFKNKIEIYNECTCVVLMYHLMCFSDFVPNASTRSELGKSFIFFIFLNVSVHLFFMLKESYSKLKLRLMRRFCNESLKK